MNIQDQYDNLEAKTDTSSSFASDQHKKIMKELEKYKSTPTKTESMARAFDRIDNMKRIGPALTCCGYKAI